ncbi:MAG: cell division/cell wall cluster transcriptional repressor MraZ [Alphaproteobacteria bacterium]|nr:cell division/cell wall cluster transcriptional repressor MraZ [Alphaproteobacteria bacterium]
MHSQARALTFGQGNGPGLGRDMPLFTNTFVNRLDKKGRVSVPAEYRAELVDQAFHGIAAYSSFVLPAIECCGIDRIERLSQSIDEQFDPFSERRGAFAISILAKTARLPFDTEGRIVLSETMIAHAKLSDRVAFVGLGVTFQIWEPEAFREYDAAALERAQRERDQLRLGAPRTGEGGAR